MVPDTRLSRAPNLAASLGQTLSARPQAIQSGASSSANSWKARNVTGLNPTAKPLLSAASAAVRARVAAVQAMQAIVGRRTQRPASMPVATAATSTPANPIRTGRDISRYGAPCMVAPGP